ncbi:MAG: hypothetical protein ACKO2P_05860, partial [Planctomycetota bacterium]
MSAPVSGQAPGARPLALTFRHKVPPGGRSWDGETVVEWGLWGIVLENYYAPTLRFGAMHLMLHLCRVPGLLGTVLAASGRRRSAGRGDRKTTPEPSVAGTVPAVR